MSLWGAESEKKPVWLTKEQKDNCFATKRGWVLKRANGIEEVLVAIPNLDELTGLTSLTSISIYAKEFKTGKKMTVKMSFNEKITLEDGYKLSLQFGEEEPKTIELEVSKGNGSNLITFEHAITEEDEGEIIIPSITSEGFDLNGFEYEGQTEFPIKTGILVNQ